MLALKRLATSSLGGAAGARQLSAAAPLKATLFPGDGIGPEIADAVTLMLKTAGVPIEWDNQIVDNSKADPRTNSFISVENLESVKARKINMHGNVARLVEPIVLVCAC